MPVSALTHAMDNPDDPAIQEECARRLMAYAAKLRAANENKRVQRVRRAAV